MGVTHELLATSAITQDPTKLVMAIPAAIAGLAAASQVVTVVPQSEMGIRFRRGSPRLKPEYDKLLQDRISWLPPHERKSLTKEQTDDMIDEVAAGLTGEQLESGIYLIEGRGVKLLVPGLDKIVKVNCAHRTTALEECPVVSEENVQYEAHGKVTWFVRRDGDNPYKARIKINNEKDNKDKDKDKELEQTVASICTTGLSRVLGGRPEAELTRFHDQEAKLIARLVSEKCGEELLEYGVGLHRVWMKQAVPRGEEILKAGFIGSNSPVGAGMAAAAAAQKEGKLLHLVPPQPQEPA